VVTDHMSGVPFEVRCCVKCDLVYISDPPVAEDLHLFYDNAAGQLMHGEPSRLVARARSVLMRSEVRRLALHLPSPAAVLDFGAGDGVLTRVLVSSGYQAQAADIYPPEQWRLHDVRYHQYPPFLHPGTLLNETGPVDAVILRHVLEHILQPRDLLNQMLDRIPFIFAIVPNLDTRLAGMLGEYWYYWDPPRHLTFFTPKTLVSLAQGAGYDVVDLQLAGLDELVTSAYRWLLLRHVRRTGRSAHSRVAYWLRPTGLLASGSSAAAAITGRTTIRAVLTRRSDI
jgi:Methyltransferase domain